MQMIAIKGNIVGWYPAMFYKNNIVNGANTVLKPKIWAFIFKGKSSVMYM